MELSKCMSYMEEKIHALRWCKWFSTKVTSATSFTSINIMEREHQSAAYLAINPAGFVPAIITPEGDVLH